MAESEFTFESVRQRWEESLTSLTALRERLDALADAEEHQAEMSESISDATAQLLETAAALGAATTTAQAALAEFKSTAGAAAEFLRGDELKAARADVAELREGAESSMSLLRQGNQALQQQMTARMVELKSGIGSLRTDIQGMQHQLASRMTELESERDEARGERNELQHRLDDLEEKIARIPDRQRRKFDLA